MRTWFVGAIATLVMGALILSVEVVCAQPPCPRGGPPGDDEEMFGEPDFGGCPGGPNFTAEQKAQLVLMLAAALAQTPPPPPGPPHGDGEMPGEREFGKHLKELDLTAEQTAKINAQRKEQKSAMKSIRESLMAKRNELRDELDKEKTDKAKIESITSELKRLEAQRIDQKVNGILQIKATLTPEQFKKLGSMREKHRGKMFGPGRGHRRGHGDEREKHMEMPPGDVAE